MREASALVYCDVRTLHAWQKREKQKEEACHTHSESRSRAVFPGWRKIVHAHLREQVGLERGSLMVGVRLTHGIALGLSASMLLTWLSCDARAEGEPLPSQAQPGHLTLDARTTPPLDGDVSPPGGDAKTVEVEVAGEAAYVTPPIRGGATPFGAGFGARIGLDFSGFYIGATLLDFLGAKDVDVSYHALLYGAEFGYGFRAAAFGGTLWVVRPRLGVGNAAVFYTDPRLAVDVVTSASGSSSGSDTLTVNNLFVEPGVTLQLASGAHLVAIDGSMLVLPGIAYGGADATTWLSYSAQLQLGFRF
jgi:hypothetical protein